VKTIIELGAESLVCPFCNSRLIAALKPWEKEEIRIVKRCGVGIENGDKKKEKENKERVKRVYRNANLVLSHGALAVIALAARGIGPEVASRIIKKSKSADVEHEFYRYILEEGRYTRTKRFWE
jgi:ATP-dependent Lhr-like helicase